MNKPIEQSVLSALKAEGVKLCGDINKPWVLLLHSSLSTGGQWKILIESLSTRFCCLRIDFTGYGKAPARSKPGKEYQLYDEVVRIQQVFVQLGRDIASIPPMHVIGHSFGGAVALRFGAEFPQSVASMVLFEPVAFHLLPKTDHGFQEVKNIELFIFGAEQMDAAKRFYDYWNGDGQFEKLPKKVQQRFGHLMPVVTQDFYALMLCEKTLNDYATFDWPILLLSGEYTRESAKSVLQAMHERCTSAQVRYVKAGHMAPLSHPELVNPHIIDFIDTL